MQDQRDRTREAGPERQDKRGRTRETGGREWFSEERLVRQLGRLEEGQGTGETTWDRRINIIRYV